MKNEFKIFYSWQSDLDAKSNKYFIRDLIEKAAKEINKEIDSPMPFDLRIDSDPKLLDSVNFPKGIGSLIAFRILFNTMNLFKSKDMITYSLIYG